MIVVCTAPSGNQKKGDLLNLSKGGGGVRENFIDEIAKLFGKDEVHQVESYN